jgi:isovaleryl-CoA dehydrogenase
MRTPLDGITPLLHYLNKRSINTGATTMFTHSMTFDLGEDVNALRDMVHRWAQERVKPMAAKIDSDNVFPPELWAEMGELGLHGITVDEEFGGSNMGYLAHVIAVEEI